MEYFLGIIGLTMLISGIVLAIQALKYRTKKHPDLLSLSSYHPRNWIPVWKMRPWFTPKGYKLNLIGITLILLSSIIFIILGQLF